MFKPEIININHVNNVSYHSSIVSDPEKVLPGFKYSLVNDAKGTSPFNVNNDGVVRVKPGRKFDRETRDEYVITVVGGLSQENATYCVNVFIEDANDHRPNFTQSIYKVNVVDSTPVGTYFMAAYATDKDIGMFCSNLFNFFWCHF